MRSWTYFISIPFTLIMVTAFWVYLIRTVNSGEFDALPAWIMAGLAVHGGCIGICYHAYRTLTGTWLKSTRGKSIWQKLKERRKKK